MQSLMHHSGWVYNQKTDLLVFGLSTVFALIVAFLVPLGIEEFLSIYILIDQPHIYTTYMYTYNSKRFFREFKKELILIPILCLLTSTYLVYVWGYYSLAVLLAVYSMFHFGKQQLAWFFIASAKEGKYLNSFDRIIEKLTAYLSIFGPGIISMAYIAGRKGWRFPSDMPVLPDETIYYIYYSWLVSFTTYVGIQVYKFVKFKQISWGKNFHLLNGLFIWIIFRLIPFKEAMYFGGFLVIFGHSIPYIYLGQRYVKDRIAKGEEFFIPFSPKLYVFVILCSIGIALTYIEVFVFDNYVAGNKSRFDFFKTIMVSVVFTHYTIDGFMWKHKKHPEGLAFLK